MPHERGQLALNNTTGKLIALARHVSEHPRLPLALGVAAIVFTLPALSVGLVGDDLIQRLRQLSPAEMSQHLPDAWLVPSDSGKLGTVVWHLFDFNRFADTAERAREYGILPWWAPEDWQVALWRPLTAFTHWLDYRAFPNSPALMHTHNIAWYGLAVFLAATVYRKVGNGSGDPSGHGLWAAGLAATLFLLDKNTYGPVAYVANRGFIISLVFGLLCLHAHLRWRTTRSRLWMWLSALWLFFSLLANEGGASTLAFPLAYALVMEPGGWRARLASLLPAAAILLTWRTIYVAAGFGVRNFTGYIDPGYAPLVFLRNLAPRLNALLGGQLTGLPPEISLGLNAKWQMVLALFFAGSTLACAVAFLPVIQRDRVTRFWAVVTLLALVPAATVFPLSKNLGFVAVGAFGVIAAFLAHFTAGRERAAIRRPLRAISWCVAGWLVLAHIPGALAARAILALGSPHVQEEWARVLNYDLLPEIGGRQVVSLNDPTVLIAPFDRAYRGQSLPANVRLLVPGITPFEVKRADASTLILKAKGADLFGCPDLGPFHVGYALIAGNDLLCGQRTWNRGDQVMRKGFVAEVLDLSPRGAPRVVAFHFDKPLESEEMVCLFLDWRRLATSSFVAPRIGETVEIRGPRGLRRGEIQMTND